MLVSLLFYRAMSAFRYYFWVIIYIKLFNVQIIRKMFTSGMQDAKPSEFIQTFGKSVKHLKNISNTERNDFQLSKMFEDKKQYVMLSEQSRTLVTFRNKNHYQNRPHEDYQQKMKRENSKMQLDHIDTINDKISGLIKSISASCQKAPSKIQDKLQMASNKKYRKQLYKEDDNDALNNRLKLKSDYQKTQKKKSSQQQAQYDRYKKPSFFDDKKVMRKETSKEKQALKDMSFGNEDYDEMSLRIKKINDKINNYELKIIGSTNKNASKIHFHNKDDHFNHHKIDQKTITKTYQQQQQKPQQQPIAIPSNTKNDNQLLKSLKYKQQIIKKLNKNSSISQLKQTNSKQLQNIKQMQHRNVKKDLFNKENVGHKGHFSQKYADVRKQLSQYKTFKENEKIPSNYNAIKMRYIDPKTKEKRPSQKNTNFIDNNQINNKVLFHKLSYKPTFLKNLVKQIELDQDFRYTKYMFGGIQDLQTEQTEYENFHNAKWTNLQAELSHEGFSFNMNEIKEIFTPKDDQIDPFMSVSHSHQELIHGLIFAYQTSQKHWNQNLFRSQTAWQLKESNFSQQKMDRNKKGHITLQDLTFFINTQIDGNYRNRDLLLIFHRLTDKSKHNDSQTGLKFKNVLQHLLSF